MHSEFQPPGIIAGPHWQSMISSSGIRKVVVRQRAQKVVRVSQDILLELPDQVRLQGRLARAEPRREAPLVVLLHGWEGHSESSYILSTAQHLFDCGMDVFRLNLRDHGGTHQLNPGVFHSCRIDEVVHAVGQIAHRFANGPLFMVGFSLGGNFTLRVALRAPQAGVPLDHAVAVSPVINAASSMQALDSGPFIYRAYFMRKWRRSLRAKQAAFPDAYDFGPELGNSLGELTDVLVKNHTEYGNAEAYFDGYSVGSGRLAELRVPTTIVTSMDDPIIPISDFSEIPANPNLDICVTQQGGHCAFIENWRLESWIEHFVSSRLNLHDQRPAGLPTGETKC